MSYAREAARADQDYGATFLVQELQRDERQEAEAVRTVSGVSDAVRTGVFWTNRGRAYKHCENQHRCGGSAEVAARGAGSLRPRGCADATRSVASSPSPSCWDQLFSLILGPQGASGARLMARPFCPAARPTRRPHHQGGTDGYAGMV